MIFVHIEKDKEYKMKDFLEIMTVYKLLWKIKILENITCGMQIKVN